MNVNTNVKADYADFIRKLLHRLPEKLDINLDYLTT
jgi:hypothetical protein